MRVLFATLPGFGLTLPVIPLAWAARVAGHEVLVATTGALTKAVGEAGLAVADVCPGRDIWSELVAVVNGESEGDEAMRMAAAQGHPFGFFTLMMTEPAVAIGREFGADLVVYTSDHPGGALVAQALGVEALEVGNRVSWSMRDVKFSERSGAFNDTEIPDLVRGRLGLADQPPRPIARIDVRAPSMGGLAADATDARDQLPWWPMRYVPYNGGGLIEPWMSTRPQCPRILITLGTVVPGMSGLSSLDTVVQALTDKNVEVVIAAADADLESLGALPANVRSAGYLPLSAVLASCSLIVHHGGSGTTAAPLFYGVPQLVLPAFADNPMSAQVVADRGVGLQYDPQTLTEPIASELIDRLLTESSFAHEASAVRAEMAAMPSPAAVIDRVGRLLS